MPPESEHLPYDMGDPKDILRYAQVLVGKTLGDGVSDREFADIPPLHTKGRFGQLIEKGYFLIENNSDSVPDFLLAGLELKTTPVKRIRGGALRPKERLVLSLIDYQRIVGEDFWSSAFYRKNGQLLIVFYLHEEGKGIYDYRIIDAVIWDYGAEDLRVIREDWETIRGYVVEGRAHELSERHTRYLAANRKGAGHGMDDRIQPFSDIPAPARSFSLKASYVRTIIERDQDAQKLIRTLDEWDEERTFEGIILDRFRPYEGMPVEEIASEIGYDLNPRSKSYRADLARRILGVTSRKIEEFEKAEIETKTVMLNSRGMPKEDMSFPTFHYTEIVKQEWEDSDFFEKLNRRFLFVVFQRTPLGEDVFLGAKFWSINYQDLMEAKRVWEETARRVKEGRADDLPRMTESYVAHVRPHAQNRDDTYPLPQGGELVKKCFWLNRRFVRSQISWDS